PGKILGIPHTEFHRGLGQLIIVNPFPFRADSLYFRTLAKVIPCKDLLFPYRALKLLSYPVKQRECVPYHCGPLSRPRIMSYRQNFQGAFYNCYYTLYEYSLQHDKADGSVIECPG